jgi:hypothetical protein
MSNARIASVNLVDDASCVLSLASGSATFDLDYLKNTSRGRFTRCSAGGTVTIKGTYSGNYFYSNLVAIFRCNFELGTTFQFKGYSDNAWTTQVVDTGSLTAIDFTAMGALDFNQKFVVNFPGRFQLGSWKVIIANSIGQSNGYFDLSRLWIADYTELSYNPEYGLKNGWKEGTKTWDTDDGGVHADAMAPYRQSTFDLANLPEADRAAWMELLHTVGLRRDFFWCLYPSDTAKLLRDFTFDARVQTMPDLTTAFLDRDTVNLTIREV